MSHPGVQAVICGTSSWGQLQKNIKALNTPLHTSIVEEVNAVVKKYVQGKSRIRNTLWNTAVKGKKASPLWGSYGTD